ncbi:hypothetical protein [Lentzea flava]|uniref:hypothetical protein n=1 Tax=Lentzea flava TaxID=103732 RepID=UPI001670598B|nr:hypothetical protein [Lentzea flava]
MTEFTPDALARIVGQENVVSGADPELRRPNSGMFRPRRLRGIVRPATVEEVRQVVTTPGAGPLHAISTGRNWGLGSHHAPPRRRRPARPGPPRERAGDRPRHGWAVVEPGVTLGMLSELLDGTAGC